MLSKIYYGLGAGAIVIYLLANLLSLRSSNVAPQPHSLGAMRIERGKYVYVPPSTYPSGSNPSSSSKSSSRSSSYPSSGGFSGGK